MRTTVALDDELLTKAKELTGITETAALVRAGLTSLIEREAARRLILLGGMDPHARYIPRRRPKLD
ncbi:MAG TPA: type II toxin-antitoxin system VapB family antitoxin [Acidisarcina sp.]